MLGKRVVQTFKVFLELQLKLKVVENTHHDRKSPSEVVL